MTHYIAIIEDAGPDFAIGVWFPDLPGCTSGGDDIDEALRNASEALALYIEHLNKLPRFRSTAELKADPEVTPDLRDHIVALIALPHHAHAAE